MAHRQRSIWFPRRVSDTSLRTRPLEAPFALTDPSGNADHQHCLNMAASAKSLRRGMALTDAPQAQGGNGAQDTSWYVQGEFA